MMKGSAVVACSNVDARFDARFARFEFIKTRIGHQIGQHQFVENQRVANFMPDLPDFFTPCRVYRDKIHKRYIRSFSSSNRAFLRKRLKINDLIMPDFKIKSGIKSGSTFSPHETHPTNHHEN